MKYLDRLLFPLLLLSVQLNAQIIYVNQDAAGVGNGLSWADAFIRLDTALALATPGAQVWVAAGTYKPSALPVNDGFDLLAGVELYGGFSGNEIALEQRDWSANVTTLSGDLDGDDDSLDLTIHRSDNASHVLWVQNGDSTQRAVVDGFVIRNGNTQILATASDSIKSGGGILTTAKLTVRNCTFIENAGYAGAGIAAPYAAGSGLEVYNSVFDHNYSSYGSAGIWINESSASHVFNCVFRNNITKTGCITLDNAKGSVQDSCLFENNSSLSFRESCFNATFSTFLLKNSMFLGNTSPPVFLFGLNLDTMTLYGCRFEQNTTTFGVGIQNLADNVTFKKCIFRNNTAANGAGIYSNGLPEESFVVDSCLFENNFAIAYGGTCIYNFRNTCKVTNSVFRENYAVNSASAIYTEIGDLEVENCIFEEGYAEYAGAIANFGSIVRIDNSLFQSNIANNGGGVMTNGTQGNTVINNCIFRNNKAGYGACLFNQDDSQMVINNCLFENDSAEVSGGAFYNGFQCNMVINNTTFKRNSAIYGGAAFSTDNGTDLNMQSCTFEENNASFYGGAVYTSSGVNLNIYKSVFKSNHANSGGAIYGNGLLDSDALKIYGTQFYENEAHNGGGAIYAFNIQVDLTNCVFHANKCVSLIGDGGAIFNYAYNGLSSKIKGTNCTFSGNTGSFLTAGIYQSTVDTAQAESVFQNCVFQDEINNYGAGAGFTSVVSKGGNISSDNSLTAYFTATNDQNNQDPLLKDPVNYDFYPDAGSPCVDNGVANESPVDDITGNIRIGLPDSGAFETGTVSAPQPSDAIFLSLLPNPASEFVTVTIRNNRTGPLSLEVWDAAGKPDHLLNGRKTEREWTFQLDLKGFTSGIHLVKIQMSGDVYVGKFIKI